jgi:hypothetical protein
LLSKIPLPIIRHNVSQFIGLALLFYLVFVSKLKMVNSQYVLWNSGGDSTTRIIHDERHPDARCAVLIQACHRWSTFGLALYAARGTERTLIRRNAIRKTTNTNQHVESSGTSSKANFKSGEARNNEAIASECGERNFGRFIIQQYLLSLGVS